MKGGTRQSVRLLIGLSRRDIYNFRLLRHRLFELSTAGRWIQPDEVMFVLSIVDSLHRMVEDAHRQARYLDGFTWNALAAEVGLGEGEGNCRCRGGEHDCLRGPAESISDGTWRGHSGDDGDADPGRDQ
jgi:hypothetical protein